MVEKIRNEYLLDDFVDECSPFPTFHRSGFSPVLFTSVQIRIRRIQCTRMYAYVDVVPYVRLSLSNGIHTKFILRVLECTVRVSWSQSRGHGCAVFFSFFCVTCAADLNAAMHTHTTHTNITHACINHVNGNP